MSDELVVRPIPPSPPRELTSDEAAARFITGGRMVIVTRPDGTQRYIDPDDIWGR